MSFYGDSLLSSPDPLAMSNMSQENNTTPSPTKARPTAGPKTALFETTPNKHVQDIYISTPPARKNSSPTRSPKSTNPWRIRLTVETERAGHEQAGTSPKKSPARRLTEHTTTITVPLKRGDDTTPAAAKRGRGRPRKSLDNKKKVTGTPRPNAGGRRKTVSETLQGEDDNVNIWAHTPSKKTRGLPRKSMDAKLETPALEKAATPLRMPLADIVEDNVIDGKTSRTRSRQRRQEITPMKMSMELDVGGADSSIAQDSVPPKPRFVPVSDYVGPMKPTATHVLTPRMPKGWVPQSSPERSPTEQEDENVWRSMVHQDSGSPSMNIEKEQDESESDPTNEHQEFDTILESEGFSMVSVSSLASTGYRAADSAQQNEEFAAPLDGVSSPSISLSHQESSLQSDQDKSSMATKHTPAIASAPSAPPTLQEGPDHSPCALEEATDRTPKLVRVVRTGNALQGALSPKARNQSLSSPLHEIEKSNAQRVRSSPVSKARIPPQERADNLFSGFGAGTRRELRAGLRLGEELAKKQRLSPSEPASDSKPVSDTSIQNRDAGYPQLPSSDDKNEYTHKAPGSSSEVRYPRLGNRQLPSPEGTVVDTDDDSMNWKADTPVKTKQKVVTPVNPAAAQEESERSSNLRGERSHLSRVDENMVFREEEWQRERAAISREIEIANESQVVIINSDSEEEDVEQEQEQELELTEDPDEGDIWQAEASDNRSREPTPEASEILLQPEFVKPRRSKLPSPWRRNSQIIYSDETEPTEADLFWQPAQVNLSRLREEVSLQSEMKADDSTGALLDRQLNSVEHSRNQAISPAEASKSDNAKGPSLIKTTLEVKQSVKRKAVNKLPATPGPTFTNEFEEDITATSVGEKTLDTLPAPKVDTTAAIDPLLFQNSTKPPPKPKPIQPLSIDSSSWVSRLTAPVVNLFTASAPLPPPATKSDILCSSAHEPLCQLTPFENVHFNALAPLYSASLLYGSHIFPYNPRSASAPYLGLTVQTSLGWSRKITKSDCGVADAFMIILDERGFPLGEPGADWIEESLVVRMCVWIWQAMIMRGDIEADSWKGEKVGLRAQGDRLWTQQDIDWDNNESAYLERKRREFKGLPSWLAMGLIWDWEIMGLRQMTESDRMEVSWDPKTRMVKRMR